MPSDVPLTLYEKNDEKLNFTITSNVVGFNLLGVDEVEVYVKASAATADNDAGVWVGTVTDGDVVIEGSDTGYVIVPNTAVTTTKTWYRIDIIADSLRKTAVYGVLTVVDL
jgi:hypothetical protein